MKNNCVIVQQSLGYRFENSERGQIITPGLTHILHKERERRAPPEFGRAVIYDEDRGSACHLPEAQHRDLCDVFLREEVIMLDLLRIDPSVDARGVDSEVCRALA